MHCMLPSIVSDLLNSHLWFIIQLRSVKTYSFAHPRNRFFLPLKLSLQILCWFFLLVATIELAVFVWESLYEWVSWLFQFYGIILYILLYFLLFCFMFYTTLAYCYQGNLCYVTMSHHYCRRFVNTIPFVLYFVGFSM